VAGVDGLLVRQVAIRRFVGLESAFEIAAYNASA